MTPAQGHLTNEGRMLLRPEFVPGAGLAGTQLTTTTGCGRLSGRVVYLIMQ
jgi:hypothetical protein